MIFLWFISLLDSYQRHLHPHLIIRNGTSSVAKVIRTTFSHSSSQRSSRVMPIVTEDCSTALAFGNKSGRWDCKIYGQTFKKKNKNKKMLLLFLLVWLLPCLGKSASLTRWTKSFLWPTRVIDKLEKLVLAPLPYNNVCSFQST